MRPEIPDESKNKPRGWLDDEPVTVPDLSEWFVAGPWGRERGSGRDRTEGRVCFRPKPITSTWSM